MLRNTLVTEIQKKWTEVLVNGDLGRCLPHMVNISFPGVSGEYLALALDSKGISVATKSACREGEGTVSHVVAALSGEKSPSWRASNTIRFSLGKDTQLRDVARVVQALSEVKHTLSLHKK